jgi:L-ascorbate metabolism protein UlaG (beta-lactamase superfamily)
LVDADVVFVPTGDPHFLPAADAVKLLKQISPKVIIPAYYPRHGGAGKSPNELTKALGLKPEDMEKLVFRKKDLAGDKMRLVCLKIS